MISRLLVQVRRAASRSPHEYWTRARQRAFILGERGQLLVGGSSTRASSKSPRASQGAALLSAASTLLPGLASVSATVDALREVAPDAEQDLLARAARVERGEVPVLGFGWLDIGRTPNWHREPVSGHVAPMKHWSAIPYLDPERVGDHKVLWEFNRHQHFVTLGQAWACTGDERYVRSWIDGLESWLDQNPARVGMNWSSSLEVAYRAISWCWAAALFRSADVMPGSLAERMLESLEAHGRHVSRYLSTYFSPNTHLTGEALGLVYLGATFPQLADAARWFDDGSAILDEELSRQVYADGVYFEQATQYHRYTAEIYLHYLLLSSAAGRAPSPRLRDSLDRMFDVLLALLRADGSMPLIGDDDGGRLVQLDGDKPHQLRGLLSAAGAVLDRADLAIAGAGDDAMACWLLGESAPARLRSLREREHVMPSAHAFRDGGLYVVRDANGRGDGHAVIDAGPHGALSYGHSHADALSVELFAGGGPLFVDAGTATYVGAERNRFRATRAHNVLEVDDRSASEPATPFRWSSVTHGVADEWVDADDMTWFAGHHDGYAGLAQPVVHRRALFHPAAGVWVVEDAALTSGSHDICVRWYCDPAVVPVVTKSWNDGALLELHRDGRAAATLLVAAPAVRVSVEPAAVSPQFGRVEESKVIVLRCAANGDVRVRSIVLDRTVPGGDAAVRVSFTGQPMLEIAPVANEVGVSAGSIATRELVFGPGQASSGAEASCDAAIAWLDRDGAGRTRLAAVGVRRFVAGGNTIVDDARGTAWLVASEHEGQWQQVSGSLTPVSN